MSRTAVQKLSHDLEGIAHEVSEHLQDAAQKTGSDASDAVRRSAKGLEKALERIRSDTQHEGEKVIAGVRGHPAVSAALAVSALVAVALVFAARRFGR